jgi:hypothetical protein
MFGALGTVPPSSSPADGTAGAMRTRLVAYDHAPLMWPPGSICAHATMNPDGGVDAAGPDGSVSDGASDVATGDVHGDAALHGEHGDPVGSSGCGCAVPGRNTSTRPATWLLTAAALFAGRRVRAMRARRAPRTRCRAG